jgi:hypothetical protein
VLALGTPLFDESKVGGADITYVTLSSNDIGIWNPFSWYPYVSPSKWAAIVTEVTDVPGTVETLIDRGYGYVYLTSQTGLDTASTIMSSLLTEIDSYSNARRLQSRRLQVSEPYWGCDDTLFECRPICVKKMGVVTIKVSEKLCTAAPIDECDCKCFHDAQWTCDGESVVCKAKFGSGELQIVGDKVCETRGAPKPASTAELRVAADCEPMTEMRGSSPTAQCLAQWATPAPSDALAPQAPGAETPEGEVKPLLQESVASALAVAALALYA